MLYIDKKQTPQEVGNEISRVKREQKSLINRHETQSARTVFDCLNKNIIRNSLVKEQHGLCAYCMKRIDNSLATTIDHWQPIGANLSGALDYKNMFAVCDGGRKVDSDGNNHVLCCDASKGNKEITINPCNLEHMKKIRYSDDGRIYTYPEDKILEHDINDILNLNGLNGLDTGTRLVKGRREAYRSYAKFIQKLIREKQLSKSVLDKKIKSIESQEIYEEFAGVILYFLKRKLHQMP